MAVVASCTAGASIRYLTRGMTANSTGGKLVVLNAIVSMTACAMGGFANNWCIRQPEVTSGGIQIQDPSNGKVVGMSKICAREAIWQTASSRILMALPLFLPGCALYAMEKKGLVPKNFVLLTSLQLFLCAAQLTAAVPLSMAAFPQIMEISASKLEPEFQNIKSETNGEIIRSFRYNKGL